MRVINLNNQDFRAYQGADGPARAEEMQAAIARDANQLREDHGEDVVVKSPSGHILNTYSAAPGAKVPADTGEQGSDDVAPERGPTAAARRARRPPAEGGR